MRVANGRCWQRQTMSSSFELCRLGVELFPGRPTVRLALCLLACQQFMRVFFAPSQLEPLPTRESSDQGRRRPWNFPEELPLVDQVNILSRRLGMDGCAVARG